MKANCLTLLCLLVATNSCVGGEVVSTTPVDFCAGDPVKLKRLEDFRQEQKRTGENDTRFLARLESEAYANSMIGVAEPFWGLRKIRRGEDWGKLWAARRQSALEEVSGDKAERDSLEKSFVILEKRLSGSNAVRIISHVVRAKFGGERTWIFLVKWETDELVTRALNSKMEVTLDHYLVFAVRASDLKIISQESCL